MMDMTATRGEVHYLCIDLIVMHCLPGMAMVLAVAESMSYIA